MIGDAVRHTAGNHARVFDVNLSDMLDRRARGAAGLGLIEQRVDDVICADAPSQGVVEGLNARVGNKDDTALVIDEDGSHAVDVPLSHHVVHGQCTT